MRQAHQDRIIRAVLAVPVLWILWDALRAVFGAIAALLMAAPSERGIVTTVFLSAYGFVPGIAMAGCALLAGALMLRYPEQARARSLAFLCVCVGFVFGTFFIPTLFAELRGFEVALLPELPLPSGLGEALTFLGIALGPAFFFWFTASYPDVPDGTVGPDALGALARIQGIAFRTPLVIGVGVLPALVFALSDGSAITGVAVVVTVFVLGFGSLWLTHQTVEDAVADRTAVVAISLAAPILPFLLSPLVRFLPSQAPFFSFDVLVLTWALGLCVMVLGLTYAVFVKGVVGPALVIRRTLLIGVGGTVGLFLFAGLEELVSDLVIETLGLPSRLGTFVSAGVLAVGATWIRDRVRRNKGPARRVNPNA